MTRAKAEPLDEVAAVREAEQFISRNGYTDVWPSGTRLVYESIEMMAGGEELIEFRHDTLESKTYGIARRRKSRGPGWTVVFRYKHLPKGDGARGDYGSGWRKGAGGARGLFSGQGRKGTPEVIGDRSL